MSESPVSLLRQAAEAAPSVLPSSVGEAAATLFDLLRQWSGVPSTVRAGGEALAREVLALAEHVRPAVSREALIDQIASIRLENIKPVSGQLYVSAEAMADAIAPVLRDNGIEVK